MITLEHYDNLLDWYWSEGLERNKHCADLTRPDLILPSDSWTWKLYEAKRKFKNAKEGLGRNKPALAIWGPSQAGKSTLLARYLDDCADNHANAEGPRGE